MQSHCQTVDLRALVVDAFCPLQTSIHGAVTFKDGISTQHVTSTETEDFKMAGSENEAPTIIACNEKIDFEGGGPPTGPVANGVIYSAPLANGVIYSESPKFFEKGKDNNIEMEVHTPLNFNQGGLNRGFIETKAPIIETKAPIESVKAAVSKFGGIVDWKARRIHSMERSKPAEEKVLEDVQEEILQCRKRSEEAVEAEFQVLNELENTKRCIEELKLALEIAQTEEQQAKQDSELAKLRLEELEQAKQDSELAKLSLEELEQRTPEENDDALAKAQLEMAMAGHAAAISELKSIKEELEVLSNEYASLVCERDTAVKTADDALAASKESQRALGELTKELVALKESLESAQAAHLEAEEQRMGAALAKEQDCFKWKKELDDAEEEFCKLNLQILSIEDLKLKIVTASTLLSELKAELMVYMESVLREEISDEQHLKGEVAETEKKTGWTRQSAAFSKKRELEEVKLNIEKAIAEVECLKMAATSLKSELEEEKSTMATNKKREGKASDEAASLEAELDKNMSELAAVQGNVKEAQENSVDLTNQLKQAAEEADQAKSLAQMAREELQKAKIEAEQAKAESKAMESRILAAQKEIEASNASKMLALSAIEALQESHSSETAKEDSPTIVTISQEEYNDLSESAREAEEQASIKMTEAISQIEVAKESEAKSQEMLEEVSRELVARQEALKAATNKASEAEEGKLAVEQELRICKAEQELRIWKAEQEQLEQEQLRKDNDNQSGQEEATPTTSPRASLEVKESATGEQADSPAPQEESATGEQADSPAPQEPIEQADFPALQEPSPAPQEPIEQADSPAPQEPIEQADSPAPQEPSEQADSPAPQERIEQTDSPASQEPSQQADSPAPQEPIEQADFTAPQEPIEQADSPAPQEPSKKEKTQKSLGRTETLSSEKEKKQKSFGRTETLPSKKKQTQKSFGRTESLSSEKEQTHKSFGRTESLSEAKDGKKKKKSFFPKMLTLLSKQKSSRHKAT